MTTTNLSTPRYRAGDELPAEQKRAHNTSAASENKIHDDEIALRYGFQGGLVPGATSYAYLASYLTRTLGPAWAARGTSTISLVRPVYEGQTVTLGGRVTEASGDEARGSLTVECWVDGPDGTRCAPGSASLLWGETPATEPLPDFARTELPPRRPEERGPISAATAPVGQPLPPVVYPADPAAVTAYLDGLDEHDPLFRKASPFGPPLLHPGVYPSIANAVLARNFALGPWIHTRSMIRHLAAPLPGGDYRAFGVLTAAFEKRGHEYVTADVLILDGSDQPVARMEHTAIVVVATR